MKNTFSGTHRIFTLVLLSSVLLIGGLVVTPPSAHAASAHQNHSVQTLINSCGFDNGNYSVVVDTTSLNYYFCNPGYTGMFHQGVYNVYNNSPWTVWIKWYQTGQIPYGQYCWIPSQWNASWGGGQVLVTQLDIEASQGNLCPSF